MEIVSIGFPVFELTALTLLTGLLVVTAAAILVGALQEA
jgi:hypothetical protein